MSGPVGMVEGIDISTCNAISIGNSLVQTDFNPFERY
jgi:hypothetical protein